MNEKVLKIVLLVIGAAALVTLITLSVLLGIENSKDDDSGGSKELQYRIKNVNFPSYVSNIHHPIYTIHNMILFEYDDTRDKEHYFCVMDEDGSNIHNIYHGTITGIYRSNGVRIMPFNDNKRICLGDYIMECNTDFENANMSQTVLAPINYPEEVVNDPNLLYLWSEIIIAPDNEHYAWTTLHMTAGSINFIGKLVRGETNYTLDNLRIISDLAYLSKDENDEIVIPNAIRGGEIKQFTDGGLKVTLAGASPSKIAKGVLQDLYSTDVTILSHNPSYEETTIISPDGKLGMSMSTRFSPKTSCAIINFLERPHYAYSALNFVRYMYAYGVTDVRTHRIGNVGPALLELEKSINDREYQGYDMHDDTDNQAWVFRSPLSWSRDSKRAIWPEQNRKTGSSRIRMVEISNFDFGSPISTKTIDINKIPYALNLSILDNLPSRYITGRAYGETRDSYVDIDFQALTSRSDYHNYTIDGKTFVNGYEQYIQNRDTGEVSFTGNVTVTGPEPGSMDFRLTFNSDNYLLFENGTDGQPKSYGYSTFNGKTIYVNDMSE